MFAEWVTAFRFAGWNQLAERTQAHHLSRIVNGGPPRLVSQFFDTTIASLLDLVPPVVQLRLSEANTRSDGTTSLHQNARLR